NTTTGQEGCGEHKVLTADRQLNSDAKVIYDLLKSESARLNFIAAQATWLVYRNADCKSQSDAYQGGTEQSVADVYCLVADDSARRQNLKGFYTVLTQGLDHVPALP
ncbi:MAG: lysozyme inhibitor LprI family protein, partial [Acidimicrobiales bacterium]